MGQGRLQGRMAVITGSASGIGRAAAHLFASEGARLVLADKSEGVRETARAVEAAGGRATALVGDAADDAFVRSVIERAVADGGALDAVWANAGKSDEHVSLQEQTAEGWAEIVRVNLIAPFLAVKHAAAVMAPRGRGSIICTASVAGLRSGAAGPAYSAAKAGVVSLVQTACNELYGTGVRVNAIAPGLIETGMTRPIFERARERGTTDRIGQLNPLTRAGQPEEIAAVGLFLASDEASYVNGQTFPVDGGLSSSLPVVRRR